MAKYNKDEVNAYLEECKSKGIQDPGCLYQIQRAMWTGFPENILHAISVPGLTEGQLMKLFGLVVNGFPEQEVIQLCQEPKKLQGCLDRYYGELYRADREKIYQEVFDGFQKSWQSNFDQLLKQSNTLSDTLKFLQKKIQEQEAQLGREQEAVWENERLKQELSACEKRLQKETERADAAEREIQFSNPPKPEAVVKTVPDAKAPREKKKSWLFSCKNKKAGKKELLALVTQLDETQFEEVLDGYEKDLSMAEISQYARPEFTPEQMRKIKQLLLKMKQNEEK